ELAEHAARPPGDGAAVAQAHLGSVARQLLQLQARLGALFVAAARVVDDLEQRYAAYGELRDGLAALLLAVDEGKLGHGLSRFFQLVLNGKRNATSSARASSSVFAVVVMAMFMPRSVS